MAALRKHIITRFFTFLTGIIFLNASFFLAELSLLQTSSSELTKTIANVMLNAGLEEEHDGESSEDSATKEVDFLMHHVNLLKQRSSFLIATKATHMLVDHYPHANYAQTFSPPPDTNIFS